MFELYPIMTDIAQGWVYRTFLKHPNENRFSGDAFVTELGKKGIVVGDNRQFWLLNDLIIGVGTLAQKDIN
ncbi:MAG TPA: hypothetical protein PKD11_00920 [Pyrinomonadaceae bacterium]|nr:hypothetical protein [Pyrinomonadaceae bacterium]